MDDRLLRQPKFGWRGYTLVQQLVTRRAEYPDHVPLAVRHKSPSAVSLVAGTVSDFQYACLATGFAPQWQVGIFPAEALKRAVFVWSARIVDRLLVRLSLMKGAPLRFRSHCRALRRAIALIAVRRPYVEVRVADSAFPAVSGYVGLFSPATPPGLPRAPGRAIQLVRANCLELSRAIGAKQVMHWRAVA